MSPKVSLCIPYHDTLDTARQLSNLLGSIAGQSFKDYEIILIRDGAFAENHNAAIKKARGEIIHFLGKDDYFAHSEALRCIVDGFTGEWQITACLHDDGESVGNQHIPEWTNDIYMGNNRLGGLSTLSFRKDTKMMFEEPLKWLIDVDFYYRLYLKYGFPHINNDFGVVIGTQRGRMTDTILQDDKNKELEYLISKYGR